MKETYENMKSILDKIKYAEHEWVICGDLKVLSILLGQQGGNTKYPCFLCLWDSRAKQDHWIKREWPSREVFILGEKNIKNIPLVKRKNIIATTAHQVGVNETVRQGFGQRGRVFQIPLYKVSEAYL